MLWQDRSTIVSTCSLIGNSFNNLPDTLTYYSRTRCIYFCVYELVYHKRPFCFGLVSAGTFHHILKYKDKAKKKCNSYCRITVSMKWFLTSNQKTQRRIFCDKPPRNYITVDIDWNFFVIELTVKKGFFRFYLTIDLTFYVNI